MKSIDRVHVWATAQPLLRLFTILVRVLLALAFVPSGLVKIMGQPFTTLPTTDPVGYFFAGFFSAPAFYQFVGYAQWMAAALLLVPRTATLGALVYLPIITNIFVITVAIGPAFAFTRLITGLLLLGSIYLLFWDWDRWKRVLPVAPAHERHGDFSIVLGLLFAAGMGLMGVMRTHAAWLRHRSMTGPLMFVAFAAMCSLVVLAVAYRRARAAAR
jgi:hypothetical protein